MKKGKYASPVIKDEYSGVRKIENNIRFNKHPKRKNNILIAGMYAAYLSGKSLEEIAKTYRKTRQAVYDTFRTRGYKLRSKELKGLVIVDGINFTEMKGYLRGTVGKRRMMMQHYVWEKNFGLVPSGFVISHIDRNKKNNNVENLELVAKKDMQKKFNPNGNNQFTKI